MVDEHAEPVGHAGRGVAVAGRAAGVERLAVERRVELRRRTARLPRRQPAPRCGAGPRSTPAKSRRRQRAQRDAPPVEAQRRRAAAADRRGGAPSAAARPERRTSRRRAANGASPRRRRSTSPARCRRASGSRPGCGRRSARGSVASARKTSSTPSRSTTCATGPSAAGRARRWPRCQASSPRTWTSWASIDPGHARGCTSSTWSMTTPMALVSWTRAWAGRGRRARSASSVGRADRDAHVAAGVGERPSTTVRSRRRAGPRAAGATQRPTGSSPPARYQA